MSVPLITVGDLVAALQKLDQSARIGSSLYRLSNAVEPFKGIMKAPDGTISLDRGMDALWFDDGQSPEPDTLEPLDLSE